MVENKVTKGTTPKKTCAKRPVKTKKTATTPKTNANQDIAINAVSVGYRAGDVYQALSIAGVALSISQIVKATSKTEAEVLLGIGWLFKEGKVKEENSLITLA